MKNEMERKIKKINFNLIKEDVTVKFSATVEDYDVVFFDRQIGSNYSSGQITNDEARKWLERLNRLDIDQMCREGHEPMPAKNILGSYIEFDRENGVSRSDFFEGGCPKTFKPLLCLLDSLFAPFSFRYHFDDASHKKINLSVAILKQAYIPNNLITVNKVENMFDVCHKKAEYEINKLVNRGLLEYSDLRGGYVLKEQ